MLTSWTDAEWTLDDLIDESSGALGAMRDKVTKRGKKNETHKRNHIHANEAGYLLVDKTALTHAPPYIGGSLSVHVNGEDLRSHYGTAIRGTKGRWLFVDATKLAALPKGAQARSSGFAYSVSITDVTPKRRATRWRKARKAKVMSYTFFVTINRERATLAAPYNLSYAGNTLRLLSYCINTMGMIDAYWTAVLSTQGASGRIIAVINQNDAKRIFSDRDKTALTKDGKRRPILHWTKAHFRRVQVSVPVWRRLLGRIFPRLIPSPKLRPVKTHMRGLTEFETHGLMCRIGHPGKHSEPFYSSDDFSVIGEYDDPDVQLDDLPAKEIKRIVKAARKGPVWHDNDTR